MTQQKQQHTLFRNPMTIKRFPELLLISNEQLSAYFAAPLPVVNQEKPPGRDRKQETRSMPPLKNAKKPFRPCNPREAKNMIRSLPVSVYNGSSYDSAKLFDVQYRKHHELSMRSISQHSFSPVCPTRAKEAIQVNVFQNSSSAENIMLDKVNTFQRSQLALSKYNEEGIGRVRKPDLEPLPPAVDNIHPRRPL